MGAGIGPLVRHKSRSRGAGFLNFCLNANVDFGSGGPEGPILLRSIKRPILLRAVFNRLPGSRWQVRIEVKYPVQ